MTINGKDIKLKSVLNFRDIGGVRLANGSELKSGIIFRSASIDRISQRDRAVLNKLGIRTIIDLRGPSEQKNAGIKLTA